MCRIGCQAELLDANFGFCKTSSGVESESTHHKSSQWALATGIIEPQSLGYPMKFYDELKSSIPCCVEVDELLGR